MNKIALFLALCSSVLFADFPIIGEGKTVISYLDENKKEMHTITCHQQVELDFKFNYLQCLSPTHNLEKQIHFHDALRDLYSDHLLATYKINNGKLELDQLKIYGNVCLLQKEYPNQDLAFDELQYATADQINYDYQKDEMVLLSKEESSVLYFDSVQNYRIAASKIKITKPLFADKPYVQGIGRVRFSFQDNELEKFKKHFSGKSNVEPHHG